MQGVRRNCVKFFTRIIKDFRQKELLPLKMLFFVQASTLFVLYPYITIHMRELGINVEETAIMSAVTPIMAIVMPPLAGMIADKIGNFKLLLCIFSSAGGAAALLLLLVPVGRITVTYPENVIFTIGCNVDNHSDSSIGSLEMRLAEDLPCNRTGRLSSADAFLQSKFETCGILCSSDPTVSGIPKEFLPRSSEEDDIELSVDSILRARSYTVKIVDLQTNEVTNHMYNLTLEDLSHKQSKQEALSERFMKNNENFQTAIRRISRNQYFLPTTELYQLICGEQTEDLDDSSDFLLPTSSRLSRFRRDVVDSRTCRVDYGDNTTSDMHLSTEDDVNCWLNKNTDDANISGLYNVTYLQWNKTKISPTCVYQEKEKITADVFLHNPKNNLEIMHHIKLEECQTKCLMTARRADVCTNMQKEIEYNPTLTFWVYLVVRVFIGIIGGTAFAMFEGAVIAILREHKADYGLQRIYATIGGMISSPLSGIMIDYASQGKGYTDFRPAFYLYAGLKIGGGLLMLLMNLEFKAASKNIVYDVMTVLKKVEVIALLVACFILGTAWGYIESFLFWLLQDLGGSRSLMGITVTVGGVAGIPLLALSGPIINKIGHANVIFIGFLFYAIRLLGYSLIYNPWHSLFFEAMESITTSLSFTAAVTYAAQLSTPTTDSSIQGLLGGIYFGVGKGAGSLVGGYMMKAFGTRPTYQIFAVFSFVMGCVYYLFNKFYLSKRTPELNDIKGKSKNKVIDVEIMKEKPKEVPLKYGTMLQKNNLDVISLDNKPMDGAHDNSAFIEDEKTEDTKISKEDPRRGDNNCDDKENSTAKADS